MEVHKQAWEASSDEFAPDGMKLRLAIQHPIFIYRDHIIEYYNFGDILRMNDVNDNDDCDFV